MFKKNRASAFLCLLPGSACMHTRYVVLHMTYFHQRYEISFP